eukprot:scaffold9409_cov116-Isochrysis_galbana.AAC.4
MQWQLLARHDLLRLSRTHVSLPRHRQHMPRGLCSGGCSRAYVQFLPASSWRAPAPHSCPPAALGA